MQPDNIRDHETHISFDFIHISWGKSPVEGARVHPIAVGHFFFFLTRGFVSWTKEGRRSGDEVPEAAARKLDRGIASTVVPLSPKRLHRRREPSPALFQHFAALFYLTRVPTHLRLNYSNSVLHSFLRSLQPARFPAPLLPLSTASSLYPEIFTPWQFPIAFSTSLLLSILMPHTSKRPGNSAEAHHSSDKCHLCNVPNGRVWAKTIVASICVQ